MAISLKRYIDIVSGVGGGVGVKLREFIGRLFTTNPLVPTGSFIEFTTLEDVGTYFGTASEEYKRASFYFGWISKLITRATKISFARWADAATKPTFYTRPNAATLAQLAAVANGSLNITMGANTNTISPINLSGAASFAAVATLIQTALRLGTGTQFATATCVYDAPSGRFQIQGATAGAAAAAIGVSGTGTDLGPLMGWTGANSVVSPGVAVETITQTLDASAGASNNFGSFLFIPTLTQAQRLEAATWNHAQNVAFMFMYRAASIAEASAGFTDCAGLSGTAITLATLATEYDEQVPMMILAATDYNRRNSVQNYMFQQFALTPKVTTNTDATTLDAVRANYYGRSQTAGQNVDFYQRGALTGLATAPVAMNVYANEQWLKDAASAAIMSLLLSLAKVSANAQGRSQLLTVLQSVIDTALRNGSISVGKELTTVQKLYVTQLSGRDLAWQQVQAIGYWLDCAITSYVASGGATEYKAVYTLIYSKDDTIQKVEGSHVLI